jgi:hypothetical protein
MTKTAAQLVGEFEAAWTARDGEAMRALWHPEGKLYTPIVDRPVFPKELPKLVSLQVRMSPDLKWSLLGWAANDDIVYVEWKTSQSVYGRLIEWRGMDRFALDDQGQIMEERVFADTAPFRLVGDEMLRDSAIEAARNGVSPDVFIRL